MPPPASTEQIENKLEKQVLVTKEQTSNLLQRAIKGGDICFPLIASPSQSEQEALG